eukprot:CAMPEP_0114500120 /NCGR_PEP_ID=MMETSP0109-20121206/7788_1 /TAXON_ID=29199 /ORGANISM="Chlorarachnion reptans, Strain CCCM449" /LENGTH=145 /DNA_ID=CAMNT_0001677747 /DNA_START=320 /DNA_END=757 /DNA_ORIENTATION=+
MALVLERRVIDDFNVVDVDEVERLEELLSVLADLDAGRVDFGFLRNAIHSTLALLLLELQGDTPDGTISQTLHEVSGEPGDLVPQALGRDGGDLLNNALVDMEIHGQALVVPFDDLARGALHEFCTDASHLFLISFPEKVKWLDL